MARFSRTSPQCPKCQCVMSVKNSRPMEGAAYIASRRRVCVACGYTCTTHEIIAADSEGFAINPTIEAAEFMADLLIMAKERFGDNFLIRAGAARPHNRKKDVSPERPEPDGRPAPKNERRGRGRDD